MFDFIMVIVFIILVGITGMIILSETDDDEFEE